MVYRNSLLNFFLSLVHGSKILTIKILIIIIMCRAAVC